MRATSERYRQWDDDVKMDLKATGYEDVKKRNISGKSSVEGSCEQL